MDVIELAGALARRVRALEQPPLPAEAGTAMPEAVAEEPAALESPPPQQAEAPASVDVPAEPAPPFLFVPQPAPRRKPANGLAIALGFLTALALAAAATAGGLWYYRSQGHTLSPSRRPIVGAPIKPVILAPQARAPTVAPEKITARRGAPIQPAKTRAWRGCRGRERTTGRTSALWRRADPCAGGIANRLRLGAAKAVAKRAP